MLVPMGRTTLRLLTESLRCRMARRVRLPPPPGSLSTLSGPGCPVLTDIASTPVFASILTLINEKRLQAGKSPVGFVNPVLYANPGVLGNDMPAGGEPGVPTEGFEVREGWGILLRGLGECPCFPAR